MQQVTMQLKLTDTQREILQVLSNGAILLLDKNNLLSLPDPLPGRNSAALQSSTRSFLIKNHLIEKFDKNHDIKTNCNGYIISDQGRKVLNLCLKT